MPASSLSAPARLVRAYYWMTPLFLAAAVRYGVDVRVPFIDALPGAGAAYWVFIVACAVGVTFRPALTAIVGQIETTLSVSLLILTTWIAYFNAVEAASTAEGAFVNPFTAESIGSLIISAAVFGASSIAHHGATRARRRAMS